MELEPEAVGEELPHHDADLLGVWQAFGIGDGVDVVAILIGPVGSADELLVLDLIREFDEVGERGGAGSEFVRWKDVEAQHMCGVAVVGLDGGDVEGGVRAGGHELGRRRRSGDFPRGLFGGEREDKRERGTLRPGAGDGFAVGAEGARVVAAEHVERGLDVVAVVLEAGGMHNGTALVDAVEVGLEDVVVTFEDLHDEAKIMIARVQRALPLTHELLRLQTRT